MRGSVYGPDYPAHRFARTPINHIQRLLTQLDNEEQAQANLASASTAQLCYLVRQAITIFSQSPSSATNLEPKNFLPFPEWSPPNTKPKGPSEMTVLILREALRRREIPMQVFVALITPPESDSYSKSKGSAT